MVSQVATDATVLIEGETGTGKELIARMVDRFSDLASQPFVPDCASIAPSLLESELFDAMRGAFTGADKDRVGVFEAALEEHIWPGNVRQLQHMIERLTILAPNERIDGEAVRDALSAMEPRDHSVETLLDAESEQIRKVLAATGGNKSRAAQILGIERKTLYRKLERMKL